MRALVVVLAACGRIGFDAPDEVAAPSCAVLEPSCGAMRAASCCSSPVIPGGVFDRGYDLAADMAYADRSRPAMLSSFRLDRYEVTVGRFRAFLRSGHGTQANPPALGAGAHAHIANSGWQQSWSVALPADAVALAAAVKCDPLAQTWTDEPGANENLPITCIDWFEAMAFCAWDGGFLPTEAEWHYAASGGAEQRAYPWSSPADSVAIDCSVANVGAECGAVVQAVGAMSPEGDGVWGQAELGGNVSEWVLDWNETPYPAPCNDCGNVFPGTLRVHRGGSFADAQADARAAARAGDAPMTRDRAIGVRCARPVD